MVVYAQSDPDLCPTWSSVTHALWFRTKVIPFMTKVIPTFPGWYMLKVIQSDHLIKYTQWNADLKTLGPQTVGPQARGPASPRWARISPRAREPAVPRGPALVLGNQGISGDQCRAESRDFRRISTLMAVSRDFRRDLETYGLQKL